VPELESIIDQKQPIAFLTALLRKRIISGSLLFTGIEGVGKKTAAIAFAAAYNCLNRKFVDFSNNKEKNFTKTSDQNMTLSGCGLCRSCKKIESDSHPDIITVKPAGFFIKIDQIRSLCGTLAMKPYEARLRVVIISNAQSMNPEAANALLKVLEEPPEHTIFILTAAQASDLLPTVRSRCRQIIFSPISKKNIAVFLVEKYRINRDDATIVAALANGSISKAISLSRTDWVKQRRWLLNASGLNHPESLSSRPISFSLAFAEKLLRKKELLQDSLQLLKFWLRDLIIYRYCSEKVINSDLTEELKYASEHISDASILAKIEAVRSAQKNIQLNANLRLTLETMVIKFAKNYDKRLS